MFFITFFFSARSRNVFTVYASTLGAEETSEADDVFNEKVELPVFREKVKTAHENEVRKIQRLSILFFFYLNPRHSNNNTLFVL